jgi:hypothetical protein
MRTRSREQAGRDGGAVRSWRSAERSDADLEGLASLVLRWMKGERGEGAKATEPSEGFDA